MYYYIMEPAGRKELVWQERVKSILGDLGIAGETVTPSPARTIEELAALGVVKGYSTIVAVGSENIVDKVLTALINQKGNKDTVLGIIPQNYNSALARKLNISDLKEACNALKYRKLETIDVCFIEPNKYFLTEATIETQKSVDAYISLDQIKAGLVFNSLSIKPGLEIKIVDNSLQRSSSGKVWGWLFGQKKPEINNSFFKSKMLKIETPDNSLAVKVDGEVIAKTPIVCRNRSRALKIIVARDIIKTKE